MTNRERVNTSRAADWGSLDSSTCFEICGVHARAQEEGMDGVTQLAAVGRESLENAKTLEFSGCQSLTLAPYQSFLPES